VLLSELGSRPEQPYSQRAGGHVERQRRFSGSHPGEVDELDRLPFDRREAGEALEQLASALLGRRSVQSAP
jgi:hypothetical protein